MKDISATAKPPRLLAQDADDLAVISAAVQDAVGKLADVSFEAVPRRLTLALNRFRWEAGGKSQERVRSALQIAGVLGVRSKGVPMSDPAAVISVLAVTFQPKGAAEDPSGEMHLHLAGGGVLCVEVECIDAVLADLSEPWAAMRRPKHGV